MIKFILPFLLVVIVASKSYSQDYIDEITQKTCSCAEAISDDLDKQQFTLQLGVCLLEASMPYKSKIKKDYGVDLDNIANEGQKWGEMIGTRLATTCPNVLLKISQKTSDNENEEKVTSGTITKIEKDSFVIFSLKDETGKIIKLLWLSFVTSEQDIINDYTKWEGKKVEVSFIDQELFDPKIEQYRSFHIISKIAVLKK